MSVEFLTSFAPKQDMLYRHFGEWRSDNALQWNGYELDVLRVGKTLKTGCEGMTEGLELSPL